MHRLARALPVLFLAACAARPGADLAPDAMLAEYRWERPAQQWSLPAGLEEASGLVHLTPGRLLTHDDNVSTLWRLEYGDGVTAAPLAHQPPRIDGDFEAVTVAHGRVLLLASPGLLYHAAGDPAAGGVAGPWRKCPTGIERRCNFEGLAVTGSRRALVAACKYPRHPVAGAITLYELPAPETRARPLIVDVTPVTAALSLARLRPSALAWAPARERLLVLAGKERVILEVSAHGDLVAWRRLPWGFHRQAEGLALAPDGALLIADEADGHVATLSRYPPQRAQGGSQ
ncbi:MAG: SdiA-regulated domain-containing protein [Pseudomonadota bacterium]